MRTISQVVEEVLGRSAFLSEVIAEGVGNNAEIARRIKPDVEKRLLEPVSEAAIGMALHRLAKNAKRPIFATKLFSRINDITVRSDLVQFVFQNSAELSETLEIFAKSVRGKDAFFNFSRGLRETVLIASRELEEIVSGSVRKTKHARREGLSAITIRIPEESLAVPGVYYLILKAIALDGLSLVEVTSVRTELSILFDDKDVDRAFAALKRIIGRR